MIMTLCFPAAWASTGLGSAVRGIYLLRVKTLDSPGDSCRACPPTRDAGWQGKQPLSYHEGVLRQMETRWGQESTCEGRGLGTGM